MIDVEPFYQELTRVGIRTWAGVPDSLLKEFCAHIDRVGGESHLITANEGGAVAYAAGHYLATGEPCGVYMQNSGLGNTVNPLTSLTDPEVYGIPMLLVIGWRGEPDVPDEPQHVKQGRITPGLMETLGVPFFVLPSEWKEAASCLQQAVDEMLRTSQPVALLVRKGTFRGDAKDAPRDAALSREDAIACLLDALETDDLVVSTTGKSSRELYELREARGEGHGSDFMCVGCMGHTSQVALGVAQARAERTVLCLDGDGAALMHMGSLAICGSHGGSNFLHVLINNGCHDSVGGQPTVAREIDLPAIAKSCGYGYVGRAERAEDIGAHLAKARDAEGPAFIEIIAAAGARSDLGRPTSTPGDNKRSFMTELGV